MVLDKILVESKDKTYEIDSYDNKTIEEIRINNSVYHFAELNYSQGISKLQMEDAVEEPLYHLQIEGNASQETYNGHNLFDVNNPVQCFNTTNAVDINYPIKIQEGILYSSARIGTANGGMLFFDVSDIDYITLSFICDWDDTVSNAQASGVGCNVYTEHTKGLIFGAGNYKYLTPIGKTTAAENLNIQKGYNTKTYDVTNYKYFGFTLGCNKNLGVQYWDLMVNVSTEALPYEPYVGGTPSPNPNYPQPIKTVSNLEFTVRGTNLFNIDDVKGCDKWTTDKPDGVGQFGYGTKLADGSLQSKIGVYGSGSIWTGAKILVEKSGNYHCSCEVKIDSSINTTNRKVTFALRNLTKNAGKRSTEHTVSKIGEWEKISLGYVTVPDDWVGDNVYLSTQLNGDSTQFTNLPVYFRNIMLTYGEHTEYEPYKEPVTYTIPDDLYGEHFYLGKIDLASTGIPAEYLPYTTETDSVQVYNDGDGDNSIGHVVLTTVTGKYELTGRETITYDGTSEYGYAMCALELEGIGSVPGMLGQCSKCTIASYGGSGDIFDIWGGTQNKSSVMFLLPSLSSTEEFMAILRERYDAGNPEYVIYPRESVYGTLIEYSAAGQELLKVSNVKGTSILEMNSELEPTFISADYWKQKRPLR